MENQSRQNTSLNPASRSQSVASSSNNSSETLVLTNHYQNKEETRKIIQKKVIERENERLRKEGIDGGYTTKVILSGFVPFYGGLIGSSIGREQAAKSFAEILPELVRESNLVLQQEHEQEKLSMRNERKVVADELEKKKKRVQELEAQIAQATEAANQLRVEQEQEERKKEAAIREQRNLLESSEAVAVRNLQEIREQYGVLEQEVQGERERLELEQQKAVELVRLVEKLETQKNIASLEVERLLAKWKATHIAKAIVEGKVRKLEGEIRLKDVEIRQRKENHVTVYNYWQEELGKRKQLEVRNRDLAHDLARVQVQNDELTSELKRYGPTIIHKIGDWTGVNWVAGKVGTTITCIGFGVVFKWVAPWILKLVLAYQTVGVSLAAERAAAARKSQPQEPVPAPPTPVYTVPQNQSQSPPQTLIADKKLEPTPTNEPTATIVKSEPVKEQEREISEPESAKSTETIPEKLDTKEPTNKEEPEPISKPESRKAKNKKKKKTDSN